jgi:hypothetical protein
MNAVASRVWTPVAASGVSALFVVSFFFAGLWVGEQGVQYRMFGLVEGIAAMLILYVFINTRILSRPRDLWGGVVLAYAAVASAQLVMLLLPPPGALQWIVLGVLLFFAWNAGFGVHRTRIVLALGLVALALAAVKYSVLPFIWSRTELPSTPLIDLRALEEGIKGLVVVFVPSRPIAQVFALLAIVAWALAIWLQWPPERHDDWLRELSRGDRDRLLFWLLSERRQEGREIGPRDVHGYLDPPENPR